MPQGTDGVLCLCIGRVRQNLHTPLIPLRVLRLVPRLCISGAGEDLANFECTQAAIGEYVNHKCMLSTTDTSFYRERLYHDTELHIDMMEYGLAVNWAEVDMRPLARQPDSVFNHEFDFGLAINWSEMERLNKMDLAEGKPETPRNMKHIAGRHDAAGWDAAAQIEWDGLNKMNTFEHGVSYPELRRRGIVPGKNIVDIHEDVTHSET
jgi:hypothetical protein